MNDAKLAKLAVDGDKRAIKLVRLTNQPARFLATIQVAITLSGFLGSAFAAENFSDVLVNALVKIGVPLSESVLDIISVVIITIILSYFTLVFGELVPKQVAMKKAEALALGMSGLISTISRIFAPLVSLLTISTNGVLKLLRIDPNASGDEASEEEIRMMVDVGSERGTIDIEEKEFIQNVFEFDDIKAEDIVTHRTDIIMLDIEDSMEEWNKTIISSKHTRFPVFEDTKDNVIGVLNTKDYFRLEDKSRNSVMQEAVYRAYFVPETVKADVLFRNMKREKHALAIVLDEYGGVTGIITINDLIGLLVGDISDDELDENIKLIEQLSEDTWKIYGEASLDDIYEQTGICLKKDDCETFNGLLIHTFEKVPGKDEVKELEIGSVKITGIEVSRHQVVSAVVSK